MSKSRTHKSIAITEEYPTGNAATTLSEKLAHEIEDLPCDWMGPRSTTVVRAVVKSFMLGNDDDMNKVIKEHLDGNVEDFVPITEDWTIGAMEAVDREPRYVPLIKAMLGGYYFTEDLMSDRVDTWRRMLAICENRLNAIAERGERETFVPNNFSERIGDLGTDYFGVSLRMDNVPGMLPKKLWEELAISVIMRLNGPGVGYADMDGAGMIVVQVLAFAADARFRAAMAEIAKDSGGEMRAAPPKTMTRMIGKMGTDHKHEKFPRACCNIDCVRVGITFDDVDEISRGFSVATSRFRPLRVKNTFRSDFNAAEKTFGYRCILLNLLYSEEGVTWGEVLDDAGDDMERYWTDAFPDQNYEQKGRPYYQALKAHEGLRNAPFAYVGEIQFLHREYLKMRKQSHFWYKIHRAKEFGHYGSLRADFEKYNPTQH